MIETRELPVVAEPTTPIKPSEALRLGRLTHPVHVTGLMFMGPRAACALGAIHIGWGGSRDDYYATVHRLNALTGEDPILHIGAYLFDEVERAGEDGDAAVLAYLEERGL